MSSKEVDKSSNLANAASPVDSGSSVLTERVAQIRYRRFDRQEQVQYLYCTVSDAHTCLFQFSSWTFCAVNRTSGKVCNAERRSYSVLLVTRNRMFYVEEVTASIKAVRN